MCLYGTYKIVRVVNKNQLNNHVKVDACIADEVQLLNDEGVVTLNSCCGHGRAGQIVEVRNKYGTWKEYESPPLVLIDKHSVKKAKQLGYIPYPYAMLNSDTIGIWQMQLKSGCVTEDDCKEWHLSNAIPYKKNSGVINI